MKKLLMVAFHWPPVAGSAAIRNVQMAETLREHGWEPIVVHGGRYRAYATDESIIADVDATAAFAPLLPKWRFLFPDEKVGWVPHALWRGLRAIHQGARVIWTTSPPESGHLVGWLLKRITGRPWIMDYNVEWSTNPATRWRGDQARHRRLESFLLRRVDAVCSLSARHLERLPVPARSIVVEAGYDPRRFKPTPLRMNRPFVITHMGSLFGVQRPDAFVDALNSLVVDGSIPPDRVIVRFIGNLWEGAEPLARAKFRVETSTAIPYAEVPAKLAESDALLVTLTDQGECVVPNKVYEYLAVGRPILAIVPRVNPVTEIVTQTRAGIVAEPRDARSAILAMLRDYRYEPDARVVERYALSPTIGKLAGLLDELVA